MGTNDAGYGIPLHEFDRDYRLIDSSIFILHDKGVISHSLHGEVCQSSRIVGIQSRRFCADSHFEFILGTRFGLSAARRPA